MQLTNSLLPLILTAIAVSAHPLVNGEVGPKHDSSMTGGQVNPMVAPPKPPAPAPMLPRDGVQVPPRDAPVHPFHPKAPINAPSPHVSPPVAAPMVPRAEDFPGGHGRPAPPQAPVMLPIGTSSEGISYVPRSVPEHPAAPEAPIKVPSPPVSPPVAPRANTLEAPIQAPKPPVSPRHLPSPPINPPVMAPAAPAAAPTPGEASDSRAHKHHEHKDGPKKNHGMLPTPKAAKVEGPRVVSRNNIAQTAKDMKPHAPSAPEPVEHEEPELE